MGYRTFTNLISGIADYKQGALPWGPWPMHGDPPGRTMANSGCCLCSNADVLNISPEVIYNYLYPLNGDCLFSWSLMQQKYGVIYTRYGDSTDSTTFQMLKKQMFDFVYNKNMPLLLYTHNASTNREHWVVATGFNGTLPLYSDGYGNEYPDLGAITTSMFIIHDPGTSSTYTLADELVTYGDVRSFRTVTR